MTSAIRLAMTALALLAATPAAAQQSWTNPYTGRSFNNPGSSLIDTFLQNDARRRMTMQPGAAGMPQQGSRMADARDPSFRIVNRGAAPVREIYVSSSQDSQWGPDRLGRNMLGAGQALAIRVPAGLCLNDIRAVFADGRVAERRALDTCAIVELSLP